MNEIAARITSMIDTIHTVLRDITTRIAEVRGFVRATIITLAGPHPPRTPLFWPSMRNRAARRRAGYTRTGGRRFSLEQDIEPWRRS